MLRRQQQERQQQDRKAARQAVLDRVAKAEAEAQRLAEALAPEVEAARVRAEKLRRELQRVQREAVAAEEEYRNLAGRLMGAQQQPIRARREARRELEKLAPPLVRNLPARISQRINELSIEKPPMRKTLENEDGMPVPNLAYRAWKASHEEAMQRVRQALAEAEQLPQRALSDQEMKAEARRLEDMAGLKHESDAPPVYRHGLFGMVPAVRRDEPLALE
jgi:chromosome segregation ATPase